MRAGKCRQMALAATLAPLPLLAAGDPAEQASPTPAPAAVPPGQAADVYFDPREMAHAREHLYTHMGSQTTTMLMADRFEYRNDDGDEVLLWDVDAWRGGDLNRLWLKTEGELGLDEDELEEAELQALYSRAISPFFDLQAGLRHDLEPDPSRSYAVVGLHGLAPYWFEVDAAAFVSEEGDVSARVELEQEWLLTQRLILQPRLELDLAVQDVPELGVGSGLGSVAAGLRVRYEIRRSIAPYVGVSWTRAFGDTRELARAEGEPVDTVAWVAGLRVWL